MLRLPRLAPAVLGPVHAIGPKLHDRGVHRVDAHLEAAQQALALPAPGEGGVDMPEMFELFPEELFHEGGVALLVGVGEAIA